MDVHAPHAPLHTWRDFWIHLGTITIGLLIAIGLEQSVEWMHRVHERHVLQHDLREEARKNVAEIELNYKSLDALDAYVLDLRRQVRSAKTGGTKVTYQRPPTFSIYWPDSPVWNTAKESAEVGLLPREQAGMFDLLYQLQDQLTAEVHRYFETSRRQFTFEIRFSQLDLKPGPPDLSQMSPDELREYDTLLSDMQMQLRVVRVTTNLAYPGTKAVANGIDTKDELWRAIGSEPPNSDSKKN